MDESGGKERWPPAAEDDMDAFNDETFGGDGEEFNWDAANAMFGEFEKAKTTNGSSGLEEEEEPRKTSVADPIHTYDRLLTDPVFVESKEYNDFDNENALEESISRLVMDDFDDEDEEEAMKSKLRRLGTTTNLSTYFLPPQVANKHMQWLKDTELPGQSSLLGSSVWSMHPTVIPSEKQQQQAQQSSHQSSLPQSSDLSTQGNHRVQMLNKIEQQSNNSRASPGMNHEAHHHHPSSRVQGNSEGSLFNNFFGQVQPPPGLLGSQETKNQKPVFKTVEEIEREFLDEPSPTKPSPSEQAIPSAASVNNYRRVITAEELERELMGDPSSPPVSNPPTVPMSPEHRYPTPLGQPSPSGIPKSQPPHPMQQQQPPMTPPFQTQPQHPFGTSPAIRPPPGLHTPPGLTINPIVLQHQQRMHPNMNLSMIPGGPQALAQRMAGYPIQLAPNLAAQLAFQQHQNQIRFLQMNPQLRNRIPFMMPMGPPPMGLRHEFPPGPHGIMSPNNNPFMRPTKTDDPYRGLMNEKDKQRLRNIQIIQLQNDHPYTTDYYSLMYKVRHGVSDPKHQRDFLVKLFPKKSDDHSNKNSYQPAHFENSLGKLQAVSALAPKKAIDTVIRVVDSGPTNRSGVKAYRYLLLEVEKLYECLLAIQEADIRKTLLNNADEESTLKRSEATQKVIQVLQSPEKLSEILSVKKGKMLISRLIPLMEPPVRYGVFHHMIRTFRAWAIGDGTFSVEVEKTYPFLRHCILAADMSHLIDVFNLKIDPAVFPTMVLSKLGFSLIMAAFYRAEILISESLPSVADDLAADWVLNTKLFVVSMLHHRADLPMPVEVPAKTLSHLKRFGVSAQDIEFVESKMQRWLESGSIPLN